MTVPLRILATAIAFGAAALLAVPAVAGPGDGLEGGPTLSRYGKSLTAEASHRVGTSITVTGSASWVEATLREFGVLRATEVGRGIIHALEETGHRVLITETTDENGYEEPTDPTRSAVLPDGTPNVGSDGEIRYNPSRSGPAATLGHELIHTLHFARGTFQPSRIPFGPNKGTMLDELVTIGLGQNRRLPLTENRLREQINALEGTNRQEKLLQPRTSHHGEPPLLSRPLAEGGRRSSVGESACPPRVGAVRKLKRCWGAGAE